MLYLVPTPIGNLADFTFRGISVLKEVDHILAEDTRQSSRLLRHYEITTTCSSFHSHNEHRRLTTLIEEMTNGKSMALISDAGTPGISDPGFLLVRACIEADIPVVSLPGPSAFVTALVGSGLPCDRFFFEGFLPHKKGRATKWQKLSQCEDTMIFYESPYRIVKFLNECIENCGPNRMICVAREISKIHEEYIRGTVSEVHADLSTRPSIKGEFVIILSGASNNSI